MKEGNKKDRDESYYTYNFQSDSLAQTAHHCQVPELKKKKLKKKLREKLPRHKECQVRSFSAQVKPMIICQ